MFFDFISQLLFPEYCIQCGSEGSIWCDSCLTTVPLWHSSFSTEHIADVFSVTHYDAPGVAAALYALKYSGVRHIARSCGNLFDRWFADFGVFDTASDVCIVPVPVSYQRYLQRGYNQAALLAAHVQQAIPGSSLQQCLYRTGHRSSQVGLTRQDRLRNLQGVFRVDLKHLPGTKKIVLVDDVLTTGATLDACAQAFFDVGITHISAVVFAHGKQDISLQPSDIIL